MGTIKSLLFFSSKTYYHSSVTIKLSFLKQSRTFLIQSIIYWAYVIIILLFIKYDIWLYYLKFSRLTLTPNEYRLISATCRHDKPVLTHNFNIGTNNSIRDLSMITSIVLIFTSMRYFLDAFDFR